MTDEFRDFIIENHPDPDSLPDADRWEWMFKILQTEVKMLRLARKVEQDRAREIIDNLENQLNTRRY